MGIDTACMYIDATPLFSFAVFWCPETARAQSSVVSCTELWASLNIWYFTDDFLCWLYCCLVFNDTRKALKSYRSLTSVVVLRVLASAAFLRGTTHNVITGYWGSSLLENTLSTCLYVTCGKCILLICSSENCFIRRNIVSQFIKYGLLYNFVFFR